MRTMLGTRGGGRAAAAACLMLAFCAACAGTGSGGGADDSGTALPDAAPDPGGDPLDDPGGGDLEGVGPDPVPDVQLDPDPAEDKAADGESPDPVEDPAGLDSVADGDVPPCQCQTDEDCDEVLVLGECEAGFCDPADCKCRKGIAEDYSPCMDGNPCTLNDRCIEGVCDGGQNVCPCEDDQDCEDQDDANLCNGVLRCKKGEFPYECVTDPDTVVKCEDAAGLPCVARACDPATGGCVDTPILEGEPCDDANPCTVETTCRAGACEGAALTCSDGNPCTDDACVFGKGCRFIANALPCEDGDPCTLGDACSGGACIPGLTDRCDDANPCTGDFCVPYQGCAHSNVNGGPCDDADPCTRDDVCAGGTCVGVSADACDDGEPCTDDSCGPDGCLHEPNDAPCDDGDDCTVDDACGGGTCLSGAPRDCDDGDGCTADSCDPVTGQCTHGEPPACRDEDPCTVDGCEPTSGECFHQAYDCADDDACTVDSCVAADGGPSCVHPRNTCDDGDSETIDSCDPASGECSHVCDDGDPCTDDAPGPGGVGCAFPQKDCDDGDFCTVDACDAAGNCRHKVPPCYCDDGNACTDERCDPKTGIWSNVPVSCDDDNPCTLDTCSPAEGCANAKKNCEDGDPNTYDFCNLVSGACERVLVSCEDHDPCTVDVLDDVAQTCSNLLVDCGDGDACTVDSCNPVDGTCSHVEISCADCTDPCKTYTCDPVTGSMRKEPKDCGDGDPCTTDLCAPLTGECDNVPKACRDDDLCTADSCDPATGLCRYEPTACSDGKKCNGLETCDPGTGACVPGTAPACDDGVACTADSCDAALDDCVNVWKDGARDGPAGDATCSDAVDGDCDGLVDGADPDCALEITSISPDRLPVGLTDTITIMGAGFGNTAAVKSVRFGAFEASVLSVTPGRILVELPAMPVGRVDVVVEKAHVSVKKAGGFAVEGRESGIAWGNWQWPKSATADEGGRTEKLFGQVYQPGVTPGGNPASIRAQACIGPAGTLPWASTWWTCREAAFNVVPPDNPNNFEYAVQIDPAPAGRFDAYFRFSVDGGVNWLYGDQNGSNDGCTPDQAAKITVWGKPGPGDAILNEIMWMGSNDLSKGPTDKWLELRNFTTKPFRVTGWVLVGAKTGSPPGDVVIGGAGAGHTITSDVLDAGGLLLIARQGAPADTALGSPADIVAPDMALASPNPSYPSRTFQLKANGVVLDTAVVRGDDLVHLGENGANNGTGNDRSMERNDVPGDGSLPANWHTASTSCRPAGAWKGTAPDNGHNFGSPRQPNCQP